MRFAVPEIESSRYEFKQGLIRLDPSRTNDPNIFSVIFETICGIANIGPEADGNLFIGIADKKIDADRVLQLDGTPAIRIGEHWVVGIDREAKLRGLTLDQYVQRLVGEIQTSQLSEPLKTHTLAGLDTITLRDLTVVRIMIPKQRALSFVGARAFIRQGSSTVELTGQQLVAASKRFPT